MIECKDRRAPRRSVVADIVDRYVAGSDAETVCIANADRFSTATHKIARSVEGRDVMLVDNFRPPNPPQAVGRRVDEILQHELRPPETFEEVPQPADPPAASGVITDEALRVNLTWSGLRTDLDLHGWITGPDATTSHVSYRSSASERPIALLSTDVTSSPGSEHLGVSGDRVRTVVVAVHLFAGSTVRDARPVVQLHGPIGGPKQLTPPDVGVGTWWHVGKFDAAARTFTAINTLGDVPPEAI